MVATIYRPPGRLGHSGTSILEVLDTARPATVAVVEDVHWADGATLDVLKFLGRRIDRMATVLIITYRAEEVGPDGMTARDVLESLPEAVATFREEYEEIAESYYGTIDLL